MLGTGGGTFEDVADGIVWASGGTVPGAPANATPAEVINLSLGGGGACSVAMQDAVDAAIGNGSIVVVAAGNAGSDAGGFQPASCAGVTAVSATGRRQPGQDTRTRRFFSVEARASGADPAENKSCHLNPLTVPGKRVVRLVRGIDAAASAGVAALSKSVARRRSPCRAKEILENTLRRKRVVRNARLTRLRCRHHRARRRCGCAGDRECPTAAGSAGPE